jgi:hypothetical protein
MGTTQSKAKSRFDQMKESENDVNLRFKDDPFSKNSRYDKSDMKQDWVDNDFSKDDSVKALDMPTGYDTVYKEPEGTGTSSDNSMMIIIILLIVILSSSAAGGAAFIFMQKK